MKRKSKIFVAMFIALALLMTLTLWSNDGFVEISKENTWETVKGKKLEYDGKKVEIGVIAKKYSWEFIYDPGKDMTFHTGDDKIKTVNELHLPVDTMVIFNLVNADKADSNESSFHSLWISSLRLKREVRPGETQKGWLMIDKKLIGKTNWDIPFDQGRAGKDKASYLHKLKEYQTWHLQKERGGQANHKNIRELIKSLLKLRKQFLNTMKHKNLKERVYLIRCANEKNKRCRSMFAQLFLHSKEGFKKWLKG
ncbi:MAG: hypothetical protein OEZ36_04500 [Spirochaetota bacterium]|nr:hypothetical protein [Spirochaetota bacterium]